MMRPQDSPRHFGARELKHAYACMEGTIEPDQELPVQSAPGYEVDQRLDRWQGKEASQIGCGFALRPSYRRTGITLSDRKFGEHRRECLDTGVLRVFTWIDTAATGRYLAPCAQKACPSCPCHLARLAAGFTSTHH